MNIDQLRQLVKKGESDHLEFKISTSQLKSAFETVCAFLNLKGEFIIFGVKNNRELFRNVEKNDLSALVQLHYLELLGRVP
ncbi:AlbA family DNA-binding domain-containing protein [Legionella gresilensis]|uniref:AlbA family DNA-binding domain-containing protein n=1 Tax=Legionella gresilensis TaxID=91823 RepID=UPI0013EF8380|nr:ATP-binding protein [Legionella gresilensis]